MNVELPRMNVGHCVKHGMEWNRLDWIGSDWIGMDWNGMETCHELLDGSYSCVVLKCIVLNRHCVKHGMEWI